MWKNTPRDSTVYRLIGTKCQQDRLNVKGGYGDLALIMDPKIFFSTVILNRKKSGVLQLNLTIVRTRRTLDSQSPGLLGCCQMILHMSFGILFEQIGFCSRGYL